MPHFGSNNNDNTSTGNTNAGGGRHHMQPNTDTAQGFPGGGQEATGVGAYPTSHAGPGAGFDNNNNGPTNTFAPDPFTDNSTGVGSGMGDAYQGGMGGAHQGGIGGAQQGGMGGAHQGGMGGAHQGGMGGAQQGGMGGAHQGGIGGAHQGGGRGILPTIGGNHGAAGPGSTGTNGIGTGGGGGMGQRLTGKVERVIGELVGSRSLQAKGAQKELVAGATKLQGRELAEAERLENEALMRRQGAVGHGAHPANSALGAGNIGQGGGGSGVPGAYN